VRAAAAAAAERGHERNAFCLLLVGTAGVYATMFCTQGVLPEISRDFGASPPAAALTVALMIVAVAGGAWAWLPFANRVGPARTMAAAAALLVMPTVALSVAPTLVVLLVLRVLQGLCLAGWMVAVIPYVAERFVPSLGTRTLGHYTLALVGGGLVGRVVPGVLVQTVGWRTALGVLALGPVVGALVMRRATSPSGARVRVQMRRRRQPWRSWHVIGITVTGATLNFALVAAFSLVGFRLEAAPFDLDPATSSLIFLVWLVGAAAPLLAKWAGRVGWRRLSAIGIATTATGALASTSDSLPVVVIGLGALALGMFAGTTGAQIGVSELPPSERGTTSAVYYATYYVVGGAGAYIGSLAWLLLRWDGVVLACLMACVLAGLGLLVTKAGSQRSAATALPSSARSERTLDKQR
jgi:YNFM family putative membrane transporter